MSIRDYKDDRDREQLIRLWTEVFGYSDKRNDPEFSLNNKLEQKDGLLLVAEEAGHIVGSVMGGYDGHRGWIYSLAVSPGKREKRLGSELLEGMEALLTQKGCCKINLQILSSNEGVREFYRKNGYREEERISMGKVIEANIPV
ncbi:MAG: GNAT family acetyltransferase [Spirochaetales bacterium]|nr:GNAT family acetyltransferase [Spirochaetales bacterium]